MEMSNALKWEHHWNVHIQLKDDCEYIYIYICICVYIYYTYYTYHAYHTDIIIYIYHMSLYICIYIYVIYLCMCIYIHIRVAIYTYIYINICMYIHNTCFFPQFLHDSNGNTIAVRKPPGSQELDKNILWPCQRCHCAFEPW